MITAQKEKRNYQQIAARIKRNTLKKAIPLDSIATKKIRFCFNELVTPPPRDRNYRKKGYDNGKRWCDVIYKFICKIHLQIHAHHSSFMFLEFYECTTLHLFSIEFPLISTFVARSTYSIKACSLLLFAKMERNCRRQNTANSAQASLGTTAKYSCSKQGQASVIGISKSLEIWGKNCSK